MRQNLARLLDRSVVYLFNEAELGYKSLDGAGCGGAAFFIHQKWKYQIGSSSSSFKDRVIWIVLKGIPGGDLGILNIYAPNDQHERKELWLSLQEILPKDIRWLVGGDFTMVKRERNKSSYYSKLISPSERLAWETVKLNMGVCDTFDARNGLHFSWNNGRQDGQRILARLDM